MGRMGSSPRPMPSRRSIPTRPSLLARLRSGDDVEAWEEFYRVYGDLLRRFALKGGLTESETEVVVQETAIGVARNLPGFRYDPLALADTRRFHGSTIRSMPLRPSCTAPKPDGRPSAWHPVPPESRCA